MTLERSRNQYVAVLNAQKHANVDPAPFPETQTVTVSH